MKIYLRASLISFVVSTLLFRRQIQYFSVPQTRYLFPWSHLDAAILVGMVLVFTAIGVGLYAIVRAINNPKLTNIMGHVWLVPLVVGVLSQTDRVASLPPAGHWAWIIALLVVLTVSAMNPKWRIVQGCAVVCMILSPLALFTIGRVPFWKTWHHAPEMFKPVAGKPDAVPIFIFSFDAMGWPHLRNGTEVRKEFPNIRELSQHAWRFPEARSVGPRTGLSLPAMAYQIDAPYKVPDIIPYAKKKIREPSFLIRNAVVPSKQATSIFATAEKSGYQTAMVTFYLPWRQILGPDQCDYVHVYDCEPHGEGFLGKTFDTLYRNLRYYPYPNSEKIWTRRYAKEFSEHWARINLEMQDEAKQMIQTASPSTLAFFHFPLPHAPFIFNADGSYRGPYKAGRMSGTVTEYTRNLKYADLVLGKLIDQLKKAGKYDNALIILTSDHGWDLTTRARKERVVNLVQNMLMIKLPGQTTGQIHTDIIKNTSLRGAIQLAMDGKLDEDSFRKELAKISTPSKATTKKTDGPK